MKPILRKHKRFFNFKPAYQAVIFALFSSSAFAAVEATFPSVPLSLNGGAAQVKPNVLLFLDTSGSMIYGIDGTKSNVPLANQRRTVAINAAKEMLSNTRGLRWGLATFNDFRYNINGTGANGYVYGAHIRVPIADIDDQTSSGNDHFVNLQESLDKLIFGGGTPTTSAYYELLRYYRGMSGAYPGMEGRGASVQYQSPIEYRCQKNYIIFISDGQPESSPTGYVGAYDQTYASSYFYVDNRYPMKVRAGTRPLGPAFDEKLSTGESGPFSGTSTKLILENSSNVKSNGIYQCTINNTCKMYTELGMPHFARIANSQDMIKGGSDKEGKSFDEITQKNNFSKQTIVTHTIGFGVDVPMLSYTAAAGGGKYYNATSKEGLEKALKDISTSIAVGSANFAAVSPSTSTSSTGSITAAETLSLNTENWSSQLRFYQIREDGSINTNNYQLPTYNSTNSVTVISTANGPRYLRTGNGGTVRDLSNTTFGITDSNANKWQDLASWLTRQGSADNAAWGYRIRPHNDSQNQNRYLGDVLGSSLVAMGVYNKSGYTLGDSTREYLAVGSNDGMVHIFKKSGAQNHEYTDVFQYIPGMAKREGSETVNTALKKTAEEKYGGAEHINLVNGQISWYETYASNKNTRVIMSGVLGEGGRAAYALNISGKNATGGASIGLDADASQWLKGSGSGGGTAGQADYFGVPLWDTSSAVIGNVNPANGINNPDAVIGYMFGEPLNGRLAREGSRAARQSNYATSNNVFYATVLGGGFNPPSSGRDTNGNLTYPAPSVYVLDSLGLEAGATNTNYVNSTSAPGKVEKHISTAGLADNIKIDAPRGLTAVTGLDIDDDGVFDVGYAGDQNGNLYRFDFRGDISKWNAEIIFKGTESRPITAAPEVYRNNKTGRVTVLFGTGSELYASDLHDTSPQRLYGIQDPLNDDPEQGNDLATSNPAYPLQPISTELRQRTYSQSIIDGKTARTLTSTGGLGAGDKGWYMDLDQTSGERVVDKPGIGGSKRRGGTVIFSTTVFQPPSQEIQQSCTATGATQTSGFIMTLDAETGGRPVAQRLLKDNLDYIGEYRNGNLSTIKVQAGGFARSIFGGSSSGRETALGSSIPDNSTKCEAAEGNSETGVQVLKFFCPKTSVQRISWREIF